MRTGRQEAAFLYSGQGPGPRLIGVGPASVSVGRHGPPEVAYTAGESRMRSFIDGVPLFLPGVALGLCIAFVTARAIAGRLSCAPLAAWLLVVSTGVILSATVTPIADALLDGVRSSGACGIDRGGWAPPSTYLRLTEESMNVLLFVPLGMAVGLVGGRAGRRLAICGLALPFVIEATQALVPALGRSCEASDLVDNPTGFVIGLALGWSARRFAMSLRARAGMP